MHELHVPPTWLVELVVTKPCFLFKMDVELGPYLPSVLVRCYSFRCLRMGFVDKILTMVESLRCTLEQERKPHQHNTRVSASFLFPLDQRMSATQSLFFFFLSRRHAPPPPPPPPSCFALHFQFYLSTLLLHDQICFVLLRLVPRFVFCLSLVLFLCQGWVLVHNVQSVMSFFLIFSHSYHFCHCQFFE
ncbi:hypothetical protein BDV97DRAFT_82360 [Delphinella strobiligena]|nr:hypothetical protein BDV97DRAFT_82360 [Delphinella strobiligena]